MHDRKSIYDANYMFFDPVTAEINTICIGETYLYFYKETLIGVRSVRKDQDYFASMPIEDLGLYSPHLQKMTEADVQEAIDEIYTDGRTINRVPIGDLQAIAKAEIKEELEAPTP